MAPTRRVGGRAGALGCSARCNTMAAAYPSPTINETELPPRHRFVPGAGVEYYSSLFTLWNLLDRNIHDISEKIWRSGKPMKTSTPYGYMRLEQLEAYSREARHAQTYCETGFNGGHGTAAMMLANPRLQVHSFDWMQNPYAERAAQLLALYFGDRFHLHEGNSRKTVAAVAASGVVRCDLVVVDGGHFGTVVYADLKNFRKMASCGARVFIDDINENPGKQLRRAEADGLLRVTGWHMHGPGERANPCLRSYKAAKHSVNREGNTSVLRTGIKCFGTWGWASAVYGNQSGCP